MKLPLVSVIIPVYNAERFLKETLTSVLGQTYSNIEVIIIDDGSWDGSYELALKYQANNIIVRKNRSKGACAARNYGFELSSGSYIQYLDADDLLSSNKIELQVNRLKKKPDYIAVCNTFQFKDKHTNGSITDSEYLYSTNNPVSFLLKLYGSEGVPNMVQTSAWLSPRSIIENIGSWDEKLLKDQDGEFFCRAVLASKGIEYVPFAINYYRKHRTGKNVAALKQKEHLYSQLKALESKERQLLQRTNSEMFRRAMALQFKWLAINAWPQYREISKFAIIKSEFYGGSNYIPVLGGKAVEQIKAIMGWRIAKFLSYYGHKFLIRR